MKQHAGQHNAEWHCSPSAKDSTAIAKTCFCSRGRWPISWRLRDERPTATRRGGRHGKTLADELRIAEQGLLAVELKLRPEHPDVRKQRRAVEELKSASTRSAGRDADRRPTAPVVVDAAKRRRFNGPARRDRNLDRQIQAKAAEASRLSGLISTYQARIEATPVREPSSLADTRLRDACRLPTPTSCRRRRSIADVGELREAPDRRAVQGARSGTVAGASRRAPIARAST